MRYQNRIIFIAAIILSSCSKPPERSSKHNESTTTRTFKATELVTEQNRDTLRSLWITDAIAVADKSGDLQAIQVATFLKENNVLAKPEPQGVRFIEGAENNKLWFALVPLIVGDENLGPIVSRYTRADDPGFAHFLPDQRTMILKSHVKISPTWRGIITLHEANHALEFISVGYNWHDQKIFCEKERDTHNFQNRVTEKLGGENYRKLLKTLVEEIKTVHQKKGLDVGVGIWHRDHNYPELEIIFGTAESELERDFRETSVWIHVYFVIYEEHFGTTAEDQKALFLKTLYSQSGILSK